MHWVLLAIGVSIEILASVSLKLSDGFTKIGYAGLTLICFGIAFYLMSLVVRTMPLGKLVSQNRVGLKRRKSRPPLNRLSTLNGGSSAAFLVG